MFGDGDAPAAPLTRGGLPQAAMPSIKSEEIAWRTLFASDIIPNTPSTGVLLGSNEGFVRGPVELHLAVRIDLQEQ
jgi:hypothetical protein